MALRNARQSRDGSVPLPPPYIIRPEKRARNGTDAWLVELKKCVQEITHPSESQTTRTVPSYARKRVRTRNHASESPRNGQRTQTPAAEHLLGYPTPHPNANLTPHQKALLSRTERSISAFSPLHGLLLDASKDIRYPA